MKWQKHVSTCSLEASEKVRQGCISAEVDDISSAVPEHHPLTAKNCHHLHTEAEMIYLLLPSSVLPSLIIA